MTKQELKRRLKTEITAFTGAQETHAQMFLNTLVKIAEDYAIAVNWIPASHPPKIGGEYNVIWNLEDGQYPVVTSMDYDVKRRIWTDPRISSNQSVTTVLYYQPLPEALPNIDKEIWCPKVEQRPRTIDEMEGLAYGQCIHRVSMASCRKCNQRA